MSELKKDDYVICVDNDKDNIQSLTVGKIYKVVTIVNTEPEVINDNGDTLVYFSYRFRPATLLEKELSEWN